MSASTGLLDAKVPTRARVRLDNRHLGHGSGPRHRGSTARLRAAADNAHPLARPEQLEQLEQLEQATAVVAHQLSPMRLALGDAINALGHAHRYHDLGFSSLAAYAVERSGKPKRWVAESRALATSLESLTLIRRQLAHGRLPWTRAELLAKLVERSLVVHEIDNPEAAAALRPALELSWLFRSATLTCRELNEQLRSMETHAGALAREEGLRCLTLTVPSEDAWWFHSAERIFRRVAERTDLDAFLEALLAETHNTLENCGTVTREEEGLDARDRWRSQLAQWRTRAEHLCERVRRGLPEAKVRPAEHPPSAPPTPKALRTWSVLAIDEYVQTLARLLSTNAAKLGRLAEQLHRIQAWRQLGFASQGHYARERLGVSLSSLKQKRALARRLVVLPQLARALEQGQLRSVAASLVARVATSKTEQRWVERARQRTVKHLREEIMFVERTLRRRPGHQGWPPSPAVMRAELARQGDIASGRQFLRPDSERPLHAEREVRNYELGTDAACTVHAGLAPPRPSGTSCARGCDCSCLSGACVSACSAIRNMDSTGGTGAAHRTGATFEGRLSAHGQTSEHESPAHGVSSARTQAPGTETEPAEAPAPSHAVSDPTACARGARQCTIETQNHRAVRGRVVGDGLALGNVRLRMRIYESTLLLYRDVARAYARHHPTRRLLRGLCEHFLAVWSPVASRKHKYEHIYERDGYTCTSPVCERHDVTPHHLRFRSQRGGEESDNLTSLCVWCHLEGVHGGRIQAVPQPDGIHWTVGRIAPLRVIDRDRMLQ